MADPEKKGTVPVLGEGFTAAVIAGGKSSRFGAPKILAVLGSKTLLARSLDLAQRLAFHTIVILGRTSPSVQLPVPIVFDRIPDCGPLGGIYTALSTARTPFVAVLPADLPFLSDTVYTVLSRYARPDRPVVARSHRGVEPLVSIWPSGMKCVLERELKVGNRAIYHFLERGPAFQVDLPAECGEYREEWFFNINTKQDLLQASRLLRSLK